MSLDEYRRKRDFSKTPEPGAEQTQAEAGGLRFVVQKHAARRLHYDLRLEHEGRMWSWAVPKGPSYDPKQKRLAVHTEDHPLDYAGFEGVIPAGEYGGGTMMVWDRGSWEPHGDPRKGFQKGDLKFDLHGGKLNGRWVLVRMDEPNWLLIKEQDGTPIRDILELDRSAQSGRTMEEIAAGQQATVLPAWIAPQLAQSSERDNPPEGDDWLHEIKYDGYRLMARISPEGVELWTRGQQNWTGRYPAIAEALQKLPVGSYLDGELVWLDEQGRTVFAGIQKAHQRRASPNLIYYLFDALFLSGEDLRNLPLEERKQRLQQILPGQDPLRFSAHVKGQGSAVLEQAAQLQLEGIISKRADSLYQSRRSSSWLKFKCAREEEFWIVGYSEGRTKLASLMLARSEDGHLQYAGKVGTGFDQPTRDALRNALDELEAIPAPAGAPHFREVHRWVEPRLRTRVRFSDWTEAGVVRHASFLEWSKAVPERTHKLTNPQRVLDPDSGTTKGQLAAYYEEVAQRLLPHLRNRPLTLLRCPSGIKEVFFQKHLAPGYGPGVLPVAIDDETYMYIEDLQGLLGVVQMGAVELHPWGSSLDDLEHPDRLTFDLDPDPDLDWEQVAAGALEIRQRLADLGLESFCKSTGGKGLHVVLPLEPELGWQQAKTFCKALADAMAADSPQRYVSVASKARRKGKIFVDYLRNGRGQTAVSVYSARARPGIPVALPLAWEDLSSPTPPQLVRVTDTLPDDPWPDFVDLGQSISKSLKRREP